MFLALKEIKHEKLRYTLVISIIVLISYLIFILTGLAQGLASQNTSAINSWQVNSFVLNKDANINLRQSFLTKNQVHTLKQNNKQDALLGQASIVIKHKNKKQVSATMIGIKTNSFIYKDMKLMNGHKPNNDHELVLDESLINQNYHLGEWIKLNSSPQKYKIVGFTKNAKINISPIAYGTLSAWKQINNINNNFAASALVSKNRNYKTNNIDLKTYNKKTFINNLPGYQAQNMTFEFMIGFLMIISLIIITIFLYIITNQKLPNYAVLRAQGISAKLLIKTTIFQSFILVIGGIIISSVLAGLTYMVLPNNVPILFNIPTLSLVGLGLIITSILGSLIPIKIISKIDPVKIIN